MKDSLLVFATIVFFGCAKGSEAPEVLNLPEEKIPAREPPPQDNSTNHDAGEVCVLVRTVWGGNCKVEQFKCPDGTWRLDSKCYPPDWVFPWENLPDPPPDYKK